MRSNNSFGVHFIIRTSKSNENQALIFARISVDSRRIEISLKKSIDPDTWNRDKGAAKGRNEETRVLNTYLEQVRAKLTSCYQELTLKKKLVTVEAVKNLYLGVHETERTLIPIFDYHNSEMRTTLEWGTLKNYYTTRRYLEEYLKQHCKTSDIALCELNYRFLSEFERFMKSYVPKDQKKPCGQNTIMKHIERLRKVVNMAIKNEWLDRDPFQKFKPVFLKTNRQFLTAEELARIEDKEFKITRLQHAKDMFVFSCYTGLAYIDAYELTSDNLILGIDGVQWISTTRHKTDIPVKIPLLPKALDIINKYKNNPRVIESGRLLPVYANQLLNNYLKEIADICEITKPLTFHIARHTFATTVTLTNGMPIETVSKLLGHTSIRTTQIYAKVIEKKVSDDMLLLREKLNQNTKPGKKTIKKIG